MVIKRDGKGVEFTLDVPDTKDGDDILDMIQKIQKKVENYGTKRID